MTDVSTSSVSGSSMEKLIFDFLRVNKGNFTKEYPRPTGSKVLTLKRSVKMEDVRTQKLQMMPGFNISWYYTGMTVKPENKFTDQITKDFVREYSFHFIICMGQDYKNFIFFFK